MSDYSEINFKEDYELNHILSYQFNKRETEENRDILREIGDSYKFHNKVKKITDKQKFYEYVKNHYLFDELKSKRKIFNDLKKKI